MNIEKLNIEEIYKSFIRKKVEGGKRRPGLHVSDLVSDCLRKPWYRMAGTENKIDDETIPNFYYGTVIHESFDGMFEIMEKHMTVNPYEQLIEDEIVNIDKEMKQDPFKWVSGSLDAIVGDNEGILDFKTMSKLTKPYDSYVRQLNFYSYMYYLYTDIFIDKGYIFAIDKSSSFKKYKVFEYDLLEPEVNEIRMQMNMDEIAQELPPERVESYFCKWCPYYKTCSPNI